ncbi:MAG: DUF4212 domain-containing protein [Candidatus Viridilinea halotolerans]|uniref:DUF4212 domain-containing protein n=1 Tax=Candidatus Viridilinea halotolerans TaxID=2491704 RepID=A0A426TWC3_9CHLR|nr:MAG: DUF4212 domain-containing protein [Candidatus Viridilinea halotolerans]
MSEEQAAAYWKGNITIIGSLLVVWFLVSFVTSYLLAGVFNTITIGQVPLSYWMSQQGGIFIYVILIFTYAKLMDNLDKKYDVHE